MPFGYTRAPRVTGSNQAGRTRRMSRAFTTGNNGTPLIYTLFSTEEFKIDASPVVANTQAERPALVIYSTEFAANAAIHLGYYKHAGFILLQYMNTGTDIFRVDADGASFGVPITFTGAVTVNSAVTFNNTVTHNGPVIFENTITANGISTFNGAIVANSSVTVNGASTFNGTIVANGTVNLNNTVTVNGVTTFNNTVNANSSVNLNSTVTVNGVTTFNNTVNANSSVNLNSTVTVNGSTTFNNSATVNNASLSLVNSAFAPSIATVNSNTVLDSTYFTILVDAAAAAITITLPAAAGAIRRIYIIKKIDATVNAVTVDADGAELIDGAANTVLAAQWDVVRLQSDGSAWFKI